MVIGISAVVVLSGIAVCMESIVVLSCRAIACLPTLHVIRKSCMTFIVGAVINLVVGSSIILPDG